MADIENGALLNTIAQKLEILHCDNIKEYGKSVEQIQKLLALLGSKTNMFSAQEGKETLEIPEEDFDAAGYLDSGKYDIKSDTGQEVQYTEKIFSNCIYETWRRREWTEAWQYFYLVDGSGITLQDIHEHVLSSQYQPDFPQFVTVYFEKVEEE